MATRTVLEEREVLVGILARVRVDHLGGWVGGNEVIRLLAEQGITRRTNGELAAEIVQPLLLAGRLEKTHRNNGAWYRTAEKNLLGAPVSTMSYQPSAPVLLSAIPGLVGGEEARRLRQARSIPARGRRTAKKRQEKVFSPECKNCDQIDYARHGKGKGHVRLRCRQCGTIKSWPNEIPLPIMVGRPRKTPNERKNVSHEPLIVRACKLFRATGGGPFRRQSVALMLGLNSNTAKNLIARLQFDADLTAEIGQGLLRVRGSWLIWQLDPFLHLSAELATRYQLLSADSPEEDDCFSAVCARLASLSPDQQRRVLERVAAHFLR
jgi:hypothetical protein